MGAFDSVAERNLKEGNIVVVSSGYSDYKQGFDNDYGTVFERADHKMYDRKSYLKQMSKEICK